MVDVNRRHQGDESALEQKHGALPDTAESLTVGHERHILMHYSRREHLSCVPDMRESE